MTTQNKALTKTTASGSSCRGAATRSTIWREPMVGIVYADPASDTYVSVSGTAAVVDDEARKRKLWSKLAEAWFSGGPADPDLALVQVKILHANYWDVKESKLVQLYTMAKAAVTGKPPTQLGDHGEVRMR